MNLKHAKIRHFMKCAWLEQQKDPKSHVEHTLCTACRTSHVKQLDPTSTRLYKAATFAQLTLSLHNVVSIPSIVSCRRMLLNDLKVAIRPADIFNCDVVYDDRSHNHNQR